MSRLSNPPPPGRDGARSETEGAGGDRPSSRFLPLPRSRRDLPLAGAVCALSTPSTRALARARGVIGVPFRLHGRERDGMDCVGLVAWAWEVAVPTGYALRSSPHARIEAALAAHGFVAGAAPGAIVLVAPGPGQLHLGIATDDGVTHADATLRRVVERAGPLPWPVLGSWTREA